MCRDNVTGGTTDTKHETIYNPETSYNSAPSYPPFSFPLWFLHLWPRMETLKPMLPSPFSLPRGSSSYRSSICKTLPLSSVPATSSATAAARPLASSFSVARKLSKPSPIPLSGQALFLSLSCSPSRALSNDSSQFYAFINPVSLTPLIRLSQIESECPPIMVVLWHTNLTFLFIPVRFAASGGQSSVSVSPETAEWAMQGVFSLLYHSHHIIKLDFW